jgi:hypothetical protein
MGGFSTCSKFKFAVVMEKQDRSPPQIGVWGERGRDIKILE